MNAAMATASAVELALQDPRDHWERACDALMEIEALCDMLASVAERGTQGPDVLTIKAGSFGLVTSMLCERARHAQGLMKPLERVVYESMSAAAH